MKASYPFPPILVPLAIGAVALILGLFLPWWKFGSAGIGVFDAGLFPVALLIPTLGLLAMLDVCAGIVLGMKRPEHIGSFTPEQLRLVAATDALVLVVAWYFLGRVEMGLGYWASLAGAIAAFAAVVLPGRMEMMRLGLSDMPKPAVAVLAPPPVVPAVPIVAAVPVVAPVVAPVVPAPPPVAIPAPKGKAPAAANAGATVQAASPGSPDAPAGADFAPRWFRVVEPQALLDLADPSRHAATLVPNTWYLARQRAGGWLLAEGPGGAVGSVAEMYVQWAPEQPA